MATRTAACPDSSSPDGFLPAIQVPSPFSEPNIQRKFAAPFGRLHRVRHCRLQLQPARSCLLGTTILGEQASPMRLADGALIVSGMPVMKLSRT
ncbi:hypothetical protein ELH35_34100 (plasmid) [Rhizobium ruizarguesonis]|nr:hypothetical protein ELH35_34100 [Rhizobium ruizarguesonis]